MIGGGTVFHINQKIVWTHTFLVLRSHSYGGHASITSADATRNFSLIWITKAVANKSG